METRSNPDGKTGTWVGATLLIVIGVAALLANFGGGTIFYSSIPLIIGVAFLVAYIVSRQYGFLVPAGIMTGIGSGLLVSSLLGGDGGPYIVIGGGLGFLAIFAVDLLVSGQALRWWPVIPGGIMLVIGTGMASANDSLVRSLQLAAPVALIALGVLLLLTRARRPTH